MTTSVYYVTRREHIVSRETLRRLANDLHEEKPAGSPVLLSSFASSRAETRDLRDSIVPFILKLPELSTLHRCI